MEAASVEHALQVVRRGVAEILEEDELAVKFRRARDEGRPLRVKLGVDATAPTLTLGHAVVLRKLRQFQDLGHHVIFLVGDFTGRIGDPTDRSEARVQLSAEEVAENASSYVAQATRILDPARLEVAFNSRWLAQLSFADVLELASRYTVARMLEREDFQKRFAEGRPIHIHEFFYPLMQGYDSVALRADVELGGMDQKFNILMARYLQRAYGQEAEVAILMPLLIGLDGRKMSKSFRNFIALTDPPEEMFGKTMSLPDEHMVQWFETLTSVPLEEIRDMERAMQAGTLNPRDAKLRLARELVASLWGEEAAEEAHAAFRRVFQEGQLPEEMPERNVPDEPVPVARLLVHVGMAASLTEARRLVGQGAVRLDGERLTDPGALVAPGDGSVLRVGRRRFVRLRRG